MFAIFAPLPLSAIAQPGDELQPKHHLLVLSLPGGDIPRRLDLTLADEFIENPSFWQTQLVPHPPWKMTPPPSPKTFDLYQGIHVLLSRGREWGSARDKKRQTMGTVLQ